MTQSGLVAYWPFSGSAADASNNSQDGTAYGSPTQVADRFGTVSSALSFDGVDDYIAVPDSDMIDFYTVPNMSPMSVSVWVKPSVLAEGQMMIICKNQHDNSSYAYGGYWLKLVTSSGATSIAGDTWGMSTNGLAYQVGTLSTTSWTHIASVYDGSTLAFKFFVNGVLASTKMIDASYPNTYPLYIGRDNNVSGNQSWWKGGLDDIRLFNRVLNSAEVLALYSEGGWPK